MAIAGADAPRLTATAEKTREVSAWPAGQGAGAVVSLFIPRRTSKDASQTRHRYSYAGTGQG
ncbi:hypothetical protein BBK14_24975 [Parafrankia soli]|uniref:Uncharacterized protein n=1 Tax=Parafrankia soli TaxID=2599596 RepID=A0A1S1PNU4_9ACTN|nr:hypothetical protein BBK14_24975 [Parafrankia soli]CAI7978991.1 conserved hypothetical protein [Frankia sp. Hr75.2]